MRSTTGRGRRHHARGFSLLEVLAAFVILAVVATTLFQLFSGALANAGASGEWSRAVLVAESRLAAAASAQPLVETSEDGIEDDGRIHWRTEVTAYAAPDVEPELSKLSDAMATRLYRIEVAVRFPGFSGGERAFTLSTVRMAAKGNP